MAYFGGATTERPWPRFDLMAAVLVTIGLGGTAAYLLLVPKPAPAPAAAPVVVQAPVEVKPASADILVAAEALWPGQKLTATSFRIENRTIAGMEDRVFTNPNDVRGAFAAMNITPDAPLFKEQITFSAPSNVLTARIPEGYRAVSISVNAESGVEGWARPGARVDVVWTSKHRGKLIVSTIVENAQVLSAERSTDVMPRGTSTTTSVPTHITLLVPLKDAQKVQLAKASGTLGLNLRGDVDAASAGSETITVDNLLRRRDIDAMNTEVTGKVRMNGKDYVMKGQKLIPAETVAD